MINRNGSRPKILHVDDDVFQCRVISLALTRQGFEVKSAGNGQQGVSLAQEWQPDLILTDIMMPVMDGIEAARILRSTPGTNHIPILALTASADNSIRQKAAENGINEVLEKTTPSQSLVQKLHAYLHAAGRNGTNGVAK